MPETEYLEQNKMQKKLHFIFSLTVNKLSFNDIMIKRR